jgi:hypothetical protein
MLPLAFLDGHATFERIVGRSPSGILELRAMEKIRMHASVMEYVANFV